MSEGTGADERCLSASSEPVWTQLMHLATFERNRVQDKIFRRRGVSRSDRNRRFAIESLEQRTLLSVANWTGNGDGSSWSDPANWSGSTLPGPGNQVVIYPASKGAIVFAGGNVAIQSLISADPLTLSGGTLTVSGTVEVDNTFKMAGGTLADATVMPGSGGQGITFGDVSSTFDGVTTNANLDLSQAFGGTLEVVHGLTLNSVVDLGPTDPQADTFATLTFTGTESLSGSGSINFGYASQDFGGKLDPLSPGRADRHHWSADHDPRDQRVYNGRYRGNCRTGEPGDNLGRGSRLVSGVVLALP